ncbi:cytochrome b-c1 complex subunit 7-like [Limulus polyphemus]|uniref:Cytochrome b-c1 complex subunit 7 n=1 Tax=Limulus polyphemus TaxID=6850 RepID=A0ABM1B6Z8_LIMPO|nr:cytochrome b-c1 complex subunit 7-like [Limulus polyphemus]
MAVSRIFGNQALRRWAFNLTGYNKLGLLHDDCLNETEIVKEAVRRLPPDLQDARTYRMLRAMQLSLQHNILPKEQWTKFEEDVRYLEPYMNEVKMEMKEKQEWNKNY